MMIQKYLRAAISSLLLILLSLTGSAVLSQSGDSMVRFVHAIPGASPIDVYVDGELTVRNIALGAASNYINMPASQHQITVTSTGTTTPLWEQQYTPGAGKAETLVASSVEEPITFTAFEDLLEPLPPGKARFTAIHAISDSGPVDVVLDDGRPLVLGQTYNTPYGTLDIPVFNYSMAVTPTGGDIASAILNIDEVPLNSGASYMLLLYGRAANPQYTLLSTPTHPAADSDGFLKFVDAAADSPDVDVYLTGSDADSATLVASLSSPTGSASTTDYMALPSGAYSVELRSSDTQESLLSETVNIDAGAYSSAVISGPADAPALNVLADNLAMIAPDEALIRVTNASADDNVSASLGNGVILANSLAAGSSSDSAATAPGTLSLIVSSASAGMTTLPEQDFYGGVFYDILTFGDSVVLSQSAIAQGIGSAPGAAESMLVAAQPTAMPPTATPAEAVLATAAPVATAAPAETVAPPAPTIAPVIIPTNAPITGRVFNLNVDANLQLRQYPNANALSLGTVPFGTVLIVNGREGALEDIPRSSTPIPADYNYVDPVSLLTDDKEDLNP